MIEKILDPKLIVSILQVPDDRIQYQLYEPRNCTQIEWVQFLQTNIANEKMIGVWGIIKEKKLIHYIVAFNAVYPPLGREILLVYQNFFGVTDEDGTHLGKQALELIKDWGRELGAIKIHTFTEYPRVMSKFGFVEEKGSSVYLII